MNETNIAENEAGDHLFQGPSGGRDIPCEICGVRYGTHLATNYDAGYQAGNSAPEGEIREAVEVGGALLDDLQKTLVLFDGESREILQRRLKALRTLLAAARPVWVAIEDGLPPEGLYFVTIAFDVGGEKQYYAGSSNYRNGEWMQYETDAVVAWMRTPAPYTPPQPEERDA